MNFRYLSALCLLWASTWTLVGCGGGGGTGNSSGGSATAAVQPGVYYAVINNQDFWGVITPPSNGTTRWYGVHYATTNPDIYTGDVADVGTLHASVPALHYENTSNTFSNGRATLTSSGAGQLSGTLSLVSNSMLQDLVFNASTPSGFTFSQAALPSDLTGRWTGQLSFGTGSSVNFEINVASNGAVTPRAGGEEFAHCKWTAFTATPDAAVNVFAVNLQMAASTGCDTNLNQKSLTGVAFVSPLAGNLHRLIWVATTTDGHAISFKADR